MVGFFSFRGKMREGASLVSVVIAVAFLTALGVIILTVASKYLVSVYVDRNSTGNQYKAEAILEEVRAGLLEKAGDAAEEAYTEVLENYDDKSGSLRDIFSKEYLTRFMSKISDSRVTLRWPESEEDLNKAKKGKFPDSGLDSLEGQESGTNKYYVLEKLRSFSTVPNAVTLARLVDDTYIDSSSSSSDDGETLCYRVCYSDTRGYYLTLKNVTINHYDSDDDSSKVSPDKGDYQSIIKTDIMITVPDYRFEGDDTLDEAKDFLIISDGALSVDNNTNIDTEVTSEEAASDLLTTSFNGKIYTGDDKTGIRINPMSRASFVCDKLISRGSLEVATGGNVLVTGTKAEGKSVGNFYLKSIRLKKELDEDSEQSSRLTVDGNSYIADDLDIQDNNSKVSLKGKYYGYSYNENNSSQATQTRAADSGLLMSQKRDVPSTVRSDYSSAILVNGLNTELNTDGLDKLILSGRTFVSRNGNSTGSSITSDGSISDIMMGESMAVKSNQIAYLVPDDYISLSGKEGHNPITSEEAGGEDDVMNLVDLDKIKADRVYQYLNESQPVTGNFGNVTDGAGYVFIYYNFKSEGDASEYFREYYEDTETDDDGMTNKEILDDKAQVYISSTDDSGMKLSASLYLLAGSIVHNYVDGGSSKESASYYDGIHQPYVDLLDDGWKVGHDYVGMLKSLTAAGASATDGMRPAADLENLVKWNGTTDKENSISMIDTSGISNFVTKHSGTGGKVNIDEEADGAKIVVGTSSGDSYYVLNSTVASKGLVIVDGNVKVTSDFTGLIIATGKVEVVNAVKLKSDRLMMDDIFSYIGKDEELAKEMSDIFMAMDKPKKQDPTKVEECLSYINWQKNEK